MVKAVSVLALLLTSEALGACLTYGPSVATISGTLERRTFPGPPNFEDIGTGDKPETGFYLSLSAPVCVSGDANSTEAYPQSKVATIQLVLNQSGYDMLRPLLGKSITVSGALFAASTGHHHAPLLLEKVSLSRANER